MRNLLHLFQKIPGQFCLFYTRAISNQLKKALKRSISYIAKQPGMTFSRPVVKSKYSETRNRFGIRHPGLDPGSLCVLR